MEDKFAKLFKETPNYLDKITSEHKPIWGTMHVLQMVEHLTVGFKLSLSFKAYEILTPKERIPAFQRFLMGDKPFIKGSAMPKNYVDFLSPDNKDLDEAKKEFLTELNKLDQITKEDSGFWSVHESFGKLNAEQTRQLHYKHIVHHFTQFGVID